jgi:hypothetical protein
MNPSSMLYSNIISIIEKRGSSIKLTKEEINYITDNPAVCGKIEESINNIIKSITMIFRKLLY